MQEVINAVVIDDNADDLLGISKALARKGISTIPVQYLGIKEAELAYADCEGAAEAMPRIIITDIQMNHGGQEPSRTDLGNVANCVERIVAKSKGPYIILAWTSIPQHFQSLHDYLVEYLTKKGLRSPLYFNSICKNECKPDGTHYCGETIFSKFSDHISSMKELKALMSWEKSVFEAGLNTVNEIIKVTKPETIKNTLILLADQVAGTSLSNNESLAINEALTYIFKDSLSQIVSQEPNVAIWKDALTFENKPAIDVNTKASINTVLHFDKIISEQMICPGDIWEITNNIFFTNLGVSNVEEFISEFRKEFFKLSPVLHYKPICIEISPACDFAQDSKSFKSLAIGLLIPHDRNANPPLNANIFGKLKELKESVLNIPIIKDDVVYALCISKKYITALTKEKINLLETEEQGVIKKIFRMRESYLQMWIHSISMHNSRIGTVSFSQD